ncbi:MAG: hypothetical protein ACHQ50_03270 [Fimbriimonadales bacterium]
MRSLLVLCCVLLGWGCGAGAGGIVKSVPVATLLPAITAEARLQPISVPDAENGWIPFHRALSYYHSARLSAEIQLPASFKTREDAVETLHRLEVIRSCLDAALEASTKKNWLLPSDPPSVEEGSLRAKTKNIVKALIARGRAKIVTGSGVDGARDLLAAQNIGLGLLGGRGIMIDGMTGIACVTMASRAIERECGDPRTKTDAIKTLFDGNPEPPKVDARAQDDVRGELDNELVPDISSLGDPLHDAESVTDLGVSDPAQILQLAKDLDKPFDRRDTVETASLGVAIVIRNLGKPWSQQESLAPYVKKLAAGWPPGALSGGPLNAGQLDKARKFLAPQTNPVGRLIVAVLLPTFAEFASESFRWRAQAMAVRTVLAIRLWRDGHGGQLPPSLDSLVQAGILKRLPQDFFGTGPLHYDPARKVIWSVGWNQKDDGGFDPPDKFGTTKDLVWPATGS